MSDAKESKTFQFLCPACRVRAPRLERGEYHWRCDHLKVAVIEGSRGNRVVFDREEARSTAWPKFNNEGRYWTRSVSSWIRGSSEKMQLCG